MINDEAEYHTQHLLAALTYNGITDQTLIT